jgi:THO complex subunit 2
MQVHKSSKMTEQEIIALRNSEMKELAVVVWKNVTGLIGYFDLHPTKVLDIILDVFIANVIDHYDYFIELLLVSPWRPKRKPKPDVEIIDLDSGITKEEEEWVGNVTCSEVFGFKFDFYNTPGSPSIPSQVCWTAAVLIRHGIIQLEHLYTHLSPLDKDMEDEYKKYLESVNVRCLTANPVCGYAIKVGYISRCSSIM